MAPATLKVPYAATSNGMQNRLSPLAGPSFQPLSPSHASNNQVTPTNFAYSQHIASPTVSVSPQVTQAGQAFLKEIAKQLNLTVQINTLGSHEYTFYFSSSQDFYSKVALMDQFLSMQRQIGMPSLPVGTMVMMPEESEAHVQRLLKSPLPYRMKFSDQQEYQLKKQIWQRVLEIKEGYPDAENQLPVVPEGEGGCCVIA